MRFLTGALAALLVALVALLAGLFTWGRDLPAVSDLDVLEFSGQSRVYARGGELIGTLTPTLSNGYRVNRTLLRLSDISPFLLGAVVTSEDRRFYKHHGLDLIGLARGVLRTALGDTEGGSTLTQQLVKNTLLADLKSARTPERKFKEALLALQVERNFSKDEILTAYLNVIYWGSGGKSDIVGAATAARAYFGQDAQNLNLAESVYLATLIPSPGRYFKYAAYRPLMRNLLNRMVEDGRVTKVQAEAAWRYHLEPAGWRVRYDDQGKLLSATLTDREAKNRNTPPISPRPYQGFLQTVERDLIARFGRKAVYGGGGLKVYTTLDRSAQDAAERASREARVPGGATLGIALVAPQSGEVLALVGQKLDANNKAPAGEWNNAVQARRQVGSSIKPLLYALALQKGFKQSDTMLDAPLSGDYQPQNYDGRYLGRPVTLRYALDHSLNLPTVRLAQQVGVPAFEAKLRDLGLEPPPDGGLSLAIGTLEASPLQMAAAYATFAGGGVWHEPTLIKRVVDGRGVSLPLPAPESRQVWDARTAYLGLDMIRGVVNDLGPGEGGLAWRARIEGWPVGGKTGTTNDVKDLWFAGVTPEVAGAVWVGRQEGGALPQNAYSGEIPTPIWQTAVSGALAGHSPVAFRQPDGLEYRWVRGVNMAFKAEGESVTSGRVTSGRAASGLGRLWGRRRAPAPSASANTEIVPQDVPAAPDPAELARQQAAQRREELRQQALARRQELQRQLEARRQLELQQQLEAQRQQQLQQQEAERQAQRERQFEAQRQAEVRRQLEARRQQELQQQELQRQRELEQEQEARRQQELQQQQTQPDWQAPENVVPVSPDVQPLPEEQTSPDPTVPDQAAPDQTLPDPTAPDQTAPDQTAPEQTSPEQVLPDDTAVAPDQGGQDQYQDPAQDAPTQDQQLAPENPFGEGQTDPQGVATLDGSQP